MKTEYDYELISDYLKGIVSHDTAQEIKALLSRDEVARTIAKGILLLEQEFQGDEQAIEAYLDKLYVRQVKAINKTRTSPVWQNKWFKVAASVALIAAVSFWIQFISGTDLTTFVSKELSQQYPALVLRSESPAFSDAMNSYEQGNYQESIHAFERIPAINSSATATFYFALCHLYTEQYTHAAQLLNSDVLMQSRYEEQSQWYLALLYTKTKNISEAKKMLVKVSTTEGHYKKIEASELLSLMERED